MNRETFKSPRLEEQERRELRMKVGTGLADCVLHGLMTNKEAQTIYRSQFPEVSQAESPTGEEAPEIQQ